MNGPTAPISSTVAITGDVKNRSTGTMTFQDANVTVTGAVDNANSLSILGHVGHIDAPSIVTVHGTTTDKSTGTITVSNSVVNWDGAFTNNGAYISDPSKQTFTDLTIGSTGYLVGGAGDVFDITGDLFSTSAQDTKWSTGPATIEFGNVSGGSTGHTFDLTGRDLGATLAGFANNFAWGTLALDAGNAITLDGVGGSALYVGVLSGLDISGSTITNVVADGFNIYYDASLNPYLDGQTLRFAGGGELIAVGGSSPVPEPSTWAMLLVGFGGLGFAAARQARARRAVAA